MDFTVKELNDKYYNGFEFKSNNCTVILIKSDNPNKYILDFFVCDDRANGEGRQLLLNSLKYLHNKDENINTIMLASVPHTDKYKKLHLTKAEAQKKLKNYYTR